MRAREPDDHFAGLLNGLSLIGNDSRKGIAENRGRLREAYTVFLSVSDVEQMLGVEAGRDSWARDNRGAWSMDEDFVMGLSVALVDLDPDYLGLEIQAYNGRFGGSAFAYADLDGLSELVERFRGFPTIGG